MQTLQILREQIAAFDIDAFGGSAVTEDLFAPAEKRYAPPPICPTFGEHPRLLFKKETVPGILRAMKDSENAPAVAAFDALCGTQTDGTLPPPEDFPNGCHNFDAKVLSVIQAKAFRYVLTGDVRSGLEAVLAMKNNLLSLNIRYINSDQCRQYGYTMYMAALVYDWCYDLLTDDDRRQLISGVEHLICTGVNEHGAKMEVGFPPAGQGAITGHGSERQILRDYLAFAIAVYDENPSWWAFVGGRFFEEYVPVRNIYYHAGMYPQGISLYVNGRYMSDMWSAWLVKAMSGVLPYSPDMKQVVRSIFQHETVNMRSFNEGDSGNAKTELRPGFSYCAVISSYLFDDATARAHAKYMKSGFSDFSYGVAHITPPEFLICSSNGLRAAEDRHEGMPLLHYNGGYLKQVIARDTWEENAAVALMKLGERTTANHDHQDAGSFQIWYRDMLAGDTGCYAKYGSDHHKFYHQATVAHNSILVFNPALRETNKGFYSGGQRKINETGSFELWQSELFHTANLSGRELTYRDQEEKHPHYAYLAGDLAPAYDPETVRTLDRRMLTVFPEGGDARMLFVTFDRIVATDGSFLKTYLLHTVTEPTVEGKTVTTVNGGGKLTLTNLFGGDRIRKIGGEGGMNFVVNGAPLLPVKEISDGFWGRVEISPEPGHEEDILLNVMAVCDEDKTAPSATAVSADGVVGAKVGDTVFLFVTSSERRTAPIAWNSGAEKALSVYVSGVAAGTWEIAVDGRAVATAVASEDGGFLSFTVPGGFLRLTKRA